MVNTADNTLLTFLEEATGTRDVFSLDFKNLDNTTREKIDFAKVRGSVRLMSRKIKTAKDVEKLKKQFQTLRIP